MSLIPLNASNGLAVSDYLSNARDWLATAVEMTGPEQIAAVRAEIATAAEAVRQLNLSKDIRDDATEMVRRAEYAVSRSIKKGREEGLFPTQGQGGGARTDYVRERNGVIEHVRAHAADSDKSLSIKDVAPDYYYNGSELAAIGEVEPTDFENALEEAKGEGNLSRANVVRKIRQKDSGCAPRPLKQRVDEIESLAGKGASSDQIAAELGTTSEMVRRLARENGIAIRADEVRGTRIRRNYDRVLDNVIEAIEVAVMSLRDIDPASLDKETALERLDSLTSSIKELGSSAKKIKESFRDED